MEFVNLAVQFAYGQDVDLKRIAAVQSLSGTGACRIGGEFYGRFLPKGTKIYIPDPTWGNHISIFNNCGLDVQRYRYFDYANNVSLGAAGTLMIRYRRKYYHLTLLPHSMSSKMTIRTVA